MKRLLIILSAFVLSVALFIAGCGGNNGNTDNNDKADTDKTENTDMTDITDKTENTEITEMYITVGSNKLKVTLAENSTVDALVELLNNGDITYTAHANNFEIYGDIGHSLPTNNTQLTSQVGDVFLWAGDNICIFFGNNSYSYTRIGRIEGYTAAQLKEILAPSSSVQVTISLK